MDRIAERITYIVERVATVTFISLFLVVVLNIVLRNVFGATWLWIPGMSRLLFIWTVFLGTVVLYERHDHLVMDFFVSKMRDRNRARLELVINLVFLVFDILLIVNGFRVVRIRRGIPFETWNFSTSWAYLAVPAAAILMLYLCLNKLRHYAKGELYEQGV